MAILLNPRRKRKRRKRNALNPRRKRKRTSAKRKTSKRRGYVGKVARPVLVYKGTRGGKRVYGRTEKSKTKYPDVIVSNPRRKRKRNPVLTNITGLVMDGLYGAVGIAGVNAITNLASKFVNLDNVYLRSAVKLAIAVGVPTLLRKQIGSRVADVISSVAVAYVLYELIKSLLPDNVQSMVSAIEPNYYLPSRNYGSNVLTGLNAIYPEEYPVSNERYEI